MPSLQDKCNLFLSQKRLVYTEYNIAKNIYCGDILFPGHGISFWKRGGCNCYLRYNIISAASVYSTLCTTPNTLHSYSHSYSHNTPHTQNVRILITIYGYCLASLLLQPEGWPKA